MDFLELIYQTDIKLKRLGWTNQQGRDYLLQTYGKRSRYLLTDEELLDFLNYLESSSKPSENNLNLLEISFEELFDKTKLEIKRLGWTNEQGRNYLLQYYGKRSRFMLTDEEIINFLTELKKIPTPRVAQSNTVQNQLDSLDNIGDTDAIPF
jgi:virulence-associated protein VapD